MKSLSPEIISTIDKPFVAPVKLLRITFEGGFTLRLCGQVWGTPGEEYVFKGEIYEPVVIAWGANNHGAIDPVSYAVNPGETEVVIDNTVPIGGADRFTELFSLYDPHYAAVEITKIFIGATSASDEVFRFKGRIEDTLDMETDRVTLTLSGFELDIANRFDHTILTSDAFPSADPDDIGKMLGQGYGRLKHVPFRAVDAGNRTGLVVAINSTTTSIAISDATGFATSGTVQIELEKITYSGIVANSLTGCARGQGGTKAANHAAGVAVSEVQSTYVYAWGHPIQSVVAVYVDRIRQSGNYTAYTGLSGDEHPSYPGRAVIAFNTMPSLTKQINIEDQIEVEDTIDVNQGSHKHGDLAYITLNPESIRSKTTPGTYGDYMERVLGFVPDTMAFIYDSTVATFDFCGWKNPGGTPYRWRLGIVYYWPEGVTEGTIYGSFRASDGTIVSRVTVKTGQHTITNVVTSWESCSGVTWSEINNGYFKVQGYSILSHMMCCALWLDVEYRVDSSEATGVAKLGAASKLGTVVLSGNSGADVVIGSEVSVDIRGWQDDDLGTYTGTPFGLIERPDHICKHILLDRCGLSNDAIGASYAAAGAFFAANGYRLGVAVLERPNVRELLNQIAVQACSMEFWGAGTHEMVPIGGDITAAKTLTADRIDQGQGRLHFTPRVDIVNRKTGLFGREWSGHGDSIEANRAIVVAENAASISKFGTLEGSQLSFPFIIDEQQALDVLSLRLKEQAFPRIIVEMDCGYSGSDLERGDVINFDFSSGDALDKALLRLIKPQIDHFRIMDMVDVAAAIHIKAVFAASQFDLAASMVVDTETAPAVLVLDFDLTVVMTSGTDTTAAVLVLLNELTAALEGTTQTSTIEVLNVGATLELSASMAVATQTTAIDFAIEFSITAALSGATLTTAIDVFNLVEPTATIAGVTQTTAIDLGGASSPVPAGLILPFNGNPASLPASWTLWLGGSEANFLKGAPTSADPVVDTGGAAAASPYLELSEAGEHLAVGGTFYVPKDVGGVAMNPCCSPPVAAGGHTHTLETFNYTPPYGSFPFIQATADQEEIPINAVVLSTGNLSGLTNLINMAGRNLRINNAGGPANGGGNSPTADLTEGGFHAHTTFVDADHRTIVYTVEWFTYDGEHTPTGITVNVTPDLKRKLLSAWSNASAAFAPSAGMIGMWESWTPPGGWLICDGTSGTPDLRDCFIEIVATGNENISGTGDHTIDISISTTHGFGVHDHENETASMPANQRIAMRHTDADFIHTHNGTLNGHAWQPSHRTVVFIMKAS